MFTVEKEEILRRIDNLSKPSILVIGDMAIDEMVYGTTDRMSREAPVLILRHYNTKVILGAASNAAHNIASLNNGKVSVIGTYGKDYYAPILLKAFKDANVNTDYMVEDETRATTVKTRISGSCSQSVTQQIVRIDRETIDPLSKEAEEKVIAQMEKAIPLHDAVILSDYNIGLLTENVINKAIELCHKYNKIIVVDSQKDLDRFQGVTSMTPNQPDSEKFVGFFIKDQTTLKKAGEELKETLNSPDMNTKERKDSIKEAVGVAFELVRNVTGDMEAKGIRGLRAPNRGSITPTLSAQYLPDIMKQPRQQRPSNNYERGGRE